MTTPTIAETANDCIPYHVNGFLYESLVSDSFSTQKAIPCHSNNQYYKTALEWRKKQPSNKLKTIFHVIFFQICHTPVTLKLSLFFPRSCFQSAGNVVYCNRGGQHTAASSVEIIATAQSLKLSLSH